MESLVWEEKLVRIKTDCVPVEVFQSIQSVLIHTFLRVCFGVVGKLVSPVDCKSAALVHCWFKSNRLHQIWLDRIKVITSDCLSDYRGSIPRRVANFIPQ
jgi:hypothetical protein